jgi:hypothetical protein
MRFVSCGFARSALAAAFLWVPAAPGIAPPADASDLNIWDAASSLASMPSPPGLRLVWDEASTDPASTLDRLERAGFHVAVALPPHAYYVRDENIGRSMLPAGCAFRDAAPAGPSAAGSAPAPARRASLTPDVFESDPFGGREDAFPPALQDRPVFPSRRLSRAGTLRGLPFGARWTDTSEFMIGRIAVSILFPESDGTTDPNRYDWTPALRDSVVRAAVRGLSGWSMFAAQRGIPVTFAIEVHPGLATRYEPIDRTVAEEDNWIQDVLTGFLGYRSDTPTLTFDAANAARARLGAQWSVLLFAVQNATDPDGAFPDGSISHAKLGGPFFVALVNNLNTTSATLDFYIRHEIAHSFWALDEHFPSNGWWACQLTTGYFNQPNYNSVVPAPGYCGFRRGCLMYANQPDSLCDYTQRQIGWYDRNENGIFELLETRAEAFPDSEHYGAVAGSPITLRGRALEIGLWNQNPYRFFAGDTISFGTVDSVVYRIDAGPWSRATPEDGVFDAGLEGFIGTIPPLPPGEYTVSWVAWNSNGFPSYGPRTTVLSLRAASSPAGAGGGQGAAALSLRFGPTPTGGPVRFTLRARAGSSGWGTVHDVQGRQVARWPLAVPSSGTAEWSWSGRVPGGAALPSGLYFLSIEIDGAALKRRLVISH